MDNHVANVSGVFSDLLKKASTWFLYIFISADASLPSAIMKKRSNQIYWLKQLDKFNLYYNFDQLVNIVEKGIKEHYGLSPVQVLNTIYNINAYPSVSGIGSFLDNVVATSDGTYVDKNTGVQYNTTEIEKATTLSTQMNSSNSSSDFWTTFKSVVEWVISILKSVGLIKSSTSISNYTPTSKDWGNLNSQSSLGTIFPLLIAGTLLYTLMSGKNKIKTKTK